MKCALVFGLFLSLCAISSAAGQSDPSAPPVPDAPICESAEACFRAAMGPLPPLSPQERLHARLERLQAAEARDPESLWSKRARIAAAILSIETDPAEAVRRFLAAQSDFPVIDDYLRLWTGEALYKSGEVSQAADMFESVPSQSSETILVARAAFRGGEAWYRSGQCKKAIEQLSKAVGLAPQDVAAPAAQFMLADCLVREGRVPDGQAAFRQLWSRYPNAPEARDATARLSLLNGEPWRPTPDEVFTRAGAFATQALHADAVNELQRFLSMAADHPKREDAKLKLGTSLVRLKRYDQARDLYRALVSARSPYAGEAAVWLARIYLRQDAGDRLLALLSTVPPQALTGDQKAAILMLAGVWLDDQGQSDQAVGKYRQAVNSADTSALRLEAWWRIGWLQYRNGRYQMAQLAFQNILSAPDDPQWTPQALYWAGKARERMMDGQAADSHANLCRRYLYGYYCQLTQAALKPPASTTQLASEPPAGIPSEVVQELKRDRHYLKAAELKLLGMDQDAAKELSALADRYAKDRAVIMELCGLLNEAGEYHHALRLTRLYFRDAIERGAGDGVPSALWSAAYPTAYLPLIRSYAGRTVDPLLAAAIIREESQYDVRALSRVGAMGLMQVMPATAQVLQKKSGGADLGRDDLFDQETNIRFGVRYIEQLLQQFSGNVIYAVAAYNAGPQAVSAWLAKYGNREGDEFVEMIPYLETRQYVKRVLRSYREYTRLAVPACEARSLDKLC
jgi:soluble lytic murein transglycosylase